MGIQLVTFGGLRVFNDGRELASLVSQRARTALFVYLTIERRVSREALIALFWPESEPQKARHALRQSLYHIRKLVGHQDLIVSRAHEIVLREGFAADVAAFTDAVAHGDNEHAIRLYHGPFLDGVHLVDRQQWESWVDGRRARYARMFRKACRELLDVRLEARDLAGAIAVSERWVAPDPADDEAQHWLIATLAAAGERAEALRQYQTYARLLALEGLEPLDQTRVLVEQLRERTSALSRRDVRRPGGALATPDRRPSTFV